MTKELKGLNLEERVEDQGLDDQDVVDDDDAEDDSDADNLHKVEGAEGRIVYDVRLMLQALRLSVMMKRRREVKDAVVAALQMCRHARPREAVQLLEAISNGELMIPGFITLQKNRVKLDMVVMLYRRWELQQGRLDEAFINLALDSSLQMDDDYLELIEEIVHIPVPEEGCRHPLARVTMDRRRKPLAVLGLGKAGYLF